MLKSGLSRRFDWVIILGLAGTSSGPARAGDPLEPLFFPQTDGSEMERVVRKYGPLLYHKVRGRWGWSHQDAENHVQNVFVALVEFDEGFRGGPAGFEAWLMVTSRRLAVDERRRRRQIKYGGQVQHWSLIDDDMISSDPGFEDLELREIRATFERRVGQMAPECAHVLALSERGFSTEDIAQETSLHRRKVQRILNLTFNLLRSLLRSEKSELPIRFDLPLGSCSG